MKGETTTIARPYATAAFEYALQHNTLREWEAALNHAGLFADSKTIAVLLTHPQVTRDQLADLFCEGVSPALDGAQRNFIRLLAAQRRLPALAAIAACFVQYREEHEKCMTVKVVSAVALNETQFHALVARLTQRLKRTVLLECEVDVNLIGGAIAQAGDTVFDGSVKGKLNRLFEFLR